MPEGGQSGAGEGPYGWPPQWPPQWPLWMALLSASSSLAWETVGASTCPACRAPCAPWRGAVVAPWRRGRSRDGRWMKADDRGGAIAHAITHAIARTPPPDHSVRPSVATHPRRRNAPSTMVGPWMGRAPLVDGPSVYPGRNERTVLHARSQRRHASMHVWQWAMPCRACSRHSSPHA